MRRPILLSPLLLLALVAAPAPAQAPQPLPPQAETGGASDIALRTATVTGRVSARGGATAVRVEYGTSTRYGLQRAVGSLPADAAADAPVSARLTGLTTNTTYHYRVVATNDAGVARGRDRTFRTAAPPSRPGVTTDPAFAVTADGANVRGRVDPKGQPTSYSFEYGTSRRYGQSTPAADAGSGAARVRVEARLGGLRANTVYHVRLRATNATGSRAGADRTFRTAKSPLGLSLRRSTSIVRYTRPLVLTATATGTDKARLRIRLERRNFPFDEGFRPGPTARTDADGRARFVVSPFTLATEFRVVAPGRGALASPTAEVQVRALVRLRAERLSRGRVRLRGTVSPANARGTVAIQRRLGAGRYALLRRVSLRGGGPVRTFSTILRERRGTITYRAATRLRGGALRDGNSPILRVRPRR